MLTAKPWKFQAIVRLLASVFICICVGSVAAGGLGWFATGPAAGERAKFLIAGGGALLCLTGALVLLDRQWTSENVMRRAIAFLVCFYGGMLLGAWAQKMAGHTEPSVGQLLIGTLSFQGAALVLIARFLRQHQVTGSEAFGWSEGAVRAVLVGVVVALLFLPIGRLLWWAASETITHFMKPEEQQVVQTIRKASSWTHRVWLGGVTILLAPPAEEMLFRGILYPAIKQAGFPRLALWGTSLAFAGMHGSLVVFLPLLALALLLTALYERTGNLLAPIMAHALFNALNFAMVFIQ